MAGFDYKRQGLQDRLCGLGLNIEQSHEHLLKLLITHSIEVAAEGLQRALNVPVPAEISQRVTVLAPQLAPDKGQNVDDDFLLFRQQALETGFAADTGRHHKIGPGLPKLRDALLLHCAVLARHKHLAGGAAADTVETGMRHLNQLKVWNCLQQGTRACAVTAKPPEAAGIMKGCPRGQAAVKLQTPDVPGKQGRRAGLRKRQVLNDGACAGGVVQAFSAQVDHLPRLERFQGRKQRAQVALEPLDIAQELKHAAAAELRPAQGNVRYAGVIKQIKQGAGDIGPHQPGAAEENHGINQFGRARNRCNPAMRPRAGDQLVNHVHGTQGAALG